MSLSPFPSQFPLARGSMAVVAALVTLVLAGCTGPAATTTIVIPGGAGRGLPLTITHVVDGDTVDLRLPDGSTDRARLLGIDTPETVKPNTPVQCFGPEASARTKALLPASTAVLVQRDAEGRDRYGRLLVYIWRRSDGLFVNRSLVVDGYARTLSINPNTAHRSDLAQAQDQARQAGTGLWAACDADGSTKAGG